jgi:hypothetical protein
VTDADDADVYPHLNEVGSPYRTAGPTAR